MVVAKYDLDHQTFCCVLTAKAFVVNALSHNMIVKDFDLLLCAPVLPTLDHDSSRYYSIATHDSSQYYNSL